MWQRSHRHLVQVLHGQTNDRGDRGDRTERWVRVSGGRMHFYWLFEVEGALFDHRPNGWELWTARHGGGDGHWDYGWHSAWEEYNKRWSLLGVAWMRRDDPTIPDGYIAVPFSVLTVKNVDNPNK